MPKPSSPEEESTTVGSRSSMLTKTIITIVLALIVMIGLTILVIWLSIRPKRPIYFINGGSINKYTLTKDHHLNASYNLVLKSFNPNKKMHILYKKMEIKVIYENVTVASGVIDAWHQHKREQREFKLDLVSSNVVLSDTMSKHLEQAKSLGQVVLQLELKSRIKSKLGIWKSRSYHMKVSCVNVVAQFSNSSKVSHGSCNTLL